MTLGRRFWRFWAAAVLANVGDGIRVAAFPLLAAALSDEPAMVAVVAAAATLPWLVTGLVAGSLADRRSRRFLMVSADLGRVLVLGALVAAIATDRATIEAVAVAAFLLGVGETVRDTAAQSTIPRLVPRALLERANGRLVAGEVAGNEFVGPLVGAALFGAGVALPFVANSGALALAVLLVLSLPAAALAVRDTAAADAAAIPAGVRAGIRWLARHRRLRALVLAGLAVAVADSAWFAIFVLYTQQRLALGPVGFGVLLAVGAAGGLAGAFAADRLVSGRRHRSVLLWAMAVATMAPVLLLVAPELWAAVTVVVATSGAFGVFNVVAVSLRHRLVPDALLGRVTASWRTLVYGGSAAGAVAGGALASVRGLDAPFVLSAAIGALALLGWWRSSAEPSARAA
ncbi:MAG TPA: MFS transporter [Jiangellales bacterium]|nr:MFS transporter [Jiangellales bacterium]